MKCCRKSSTKTRCGEVVIAFFVIRDGLPTVILFAWNETKRREKFAVSVSRRFRLSDFGTRGTLQDSRFVCGYLPRKSRRGIFPIIGVRVQDCVGIHEDFAFARERVEFELLPGALVTHPARGRLDDGAAPEARARAALVCEPFGFGAGIGQDTTGKQQN
jgi:hypothetical protein